jgi:hypothetical protein
VLSGFVEGLRRGASEGKEETGSAVILALVEDGEQYGGASLVCKSVLAIKTKLHSSGHVGIKSVRKIVRTMPPDDIPLSHLLWKYCWPFWLFKDASCGSPFVRAAAYRHNREKRVYLPGYLMKWMCICLLAGGLTTAFEALAAQSGHMKLVFFWMSAGSGLVVAFGACVLVVTAYVYLYLSRHEG